MFLQSGEKEDCEYFFNEIMTDERDKIHEHCFGFATCNMHTLKVRQVYSEQQMLEMRQDSFVRGLRWFIH